jgi:hypothetical protein
VCLLGRNNFSSSWGPTGAQLGLHCMVCVFSKLLAPCEDVRVRERVCACVSVHLLLHRHTQDRGTFREAHAARALCSHTAALSRVSRPRVSTVTPSGSLHPGRSAAYWHTIRYRPQVQKCQMGGAASTCERVLVVACKKALWWMEACRLTRLKGCNLQTSIFGGP